MACKALDFINRLMLCGGWPDRNPLTALRSRVLRWAVEAQCHACSVVVRKVCCRWPVGVMPLGAPALRIVFYFIDVDEHDELTNDAEWAIYRPAGTVSASCQSDQDIGQD